MYLCCCRSAIKLALTPPYESARISAHTPAHTPTLITHGRSSLHPPSQLLAGRLLSGAGAANSALSFAYVTRTVEPSSRSGQLAKVTLLLYTLLYYLTTTLKNFTTVLLYC